MTQRTRPFLCIAHTVCLAGICLVLMLACGQWYALAEEKKTAASQILGSVPPSAATQKPSAFRQLLSQPATTTPQNAAQGAIRLFNTIEFKGPLQSIPQWARVMTEMNKHNATLSQVLPSSGASNSRAAWEAFRDSIRNQPLLEIVRKVNAYVNKYPYRLDQDLWGKSDYWATPAEFAARSGDCEDYAITKYYALKELNVSPKNLRIVALKDRIRGIGHAVLVVFAEGNAWVLDNQTGLVLTHDKYGHYLPQYSVNEFNRWAHVPVQ